MPVTITLVSQTALQQGTESGDLTFAWITQYVSGLKDWILSWRSTQKPRVGVWQGPNEIKEESRLPYLPWKYLVWNLKYIWPTRQSQVLNSSLPLINCNGSHEQGHGVLAVVLNYWVSPSLFYLHGATAGAGPGLVYHLLHGLIIAAFSSSSPIFPYALDFLWTFQLVDFLF